MDTPTPQEMRPMIITHATHPLAIKKLSCISSWSRWREIWDEITDVEILEGLLQCGFDCPPGDSTNVHEDRICFYLQLADSHYHIGDAVGIKASYRERNPYRTSAEERLARKAYQMLCNKLFESANNPNNLGVELRQALDHLVFPTLIWFFRPKTVGYNIPEIGTKYINIYDKTALAFLRTVIMTYWEDIIADNCTSDFGIGCSEETRKSYITLKSEIIKVMAHIGILHELLDWESYLDADCMQTLNALALGPHIRVAERYQHAETVAEAASGGIKAAEVLLLILNKRKYRLRQEVLEELEDQKQKIEQEIQNITP